MTNAIFCDVGLARTDVSEERVVSTVPNPRRLRSPGWNMAFFISM
jgi:hypothetical protein